MSAIWSLVTIIQSVPYGFLLRSNDDDPELIIKIGEYIRYKLNRHGSSAKPNCEQ